MPTLTPSRLATLLTPYYPNPEPLLPQLSLYLDLLLKWNARTNLTAIRDPEEIVQRHFGESLFAALHLPPATTLLDLGSGAGFPGIPIQLAHPHLLVTLAESQNKKSTFLREVVRTLNLATKIHPDRTETLPSETRFNVVALRAVDNPTSALLEARKHLVENGTILHLTTSESPLDAIPLPNSTRGYLHLIR